MFICIVRHIVFLGIGESQIVWHPRPNFAGQWNRAL